MRKATLLILCFVLMLAVSACSNGDLSEAAPNGGSGTEQNGSTQGGSSDVAGGSDILDLGVYKYAGYTIGKPKSWSGGSARQGFVYYSEETKDNFFFASGFLIASGKIKLCESLSEIVDACSEDLKDGVGSTGHYFSSSMEQIVDSQTEVDINGYKMLKVKGQIEGDREGHKTHYYVGYYTLFTHSAHNNGNPYPIYWLGFCKDKADLPMMEKYVDAAAETLEKTSF
ncbi:MAG: hypothetical protein FWG40_10775 [Peptococcaceae bacterium]|nr:hypothetical protein [Peptococcaceae bacterium]